MIKEDKKDITYYYINNGIKLEDFLVIEELAFDEIAYDKTKPFVKFNSILLDDLYVGLN